MLNSKLQELLNSIDNKDIVQYLCDDKFTSQLTKFDILSIIKERLNSDEQKELLYNKEFVSKQKNSHIDWQYLIESMDDKNKFEILNDISETKENLQFSDWQIAGLVKTISDEESKKKLMDTYQFANHHKTGIVSTFSTKSKTEILLSDNELNKTTILSSFSLKDLEEFITNNEAFFKNNDNHVYDYIRERSVEEQKAFINEIDNFNIDINEKKMVFATLKEETKESINIESLPEEYKVAFSMKCKPYSRYIDLDFNRNAEDYKGLDNLLRIKPEQFNKQEKEYLKKLCGVCPNLQVISVLNEVVEFDSTAKEYIEAEEWISSIINSMKPEYTDLQKMAIIDNAVGNKISYSPDFETEVYDHTESRALWKIISSGYGVCNGISKVEQYILNQVGIESEIINSKNHAFLKVKNVQIPNENGEIKTGNTILDPTWNLTAQRYGGRPDNFCINYEKAREHDIDDNGKDHNCHLNDELLQDATLSIDEQSLRKLYASIGIADKDGMFPIKHLVETSKAIDEISANNPEQNITNQFLLLAKACPNFAKCQNSSMNIISDILLQNEHLKFNKCVVNRVYNRKDKEKKPVMYVYINSNEMGQKFYYANKEDGKFENLTVDEFTNQFECYENDLKNHDGIRPWENIEQKVEKIDLSRNSGELIADGGNER
jgi:hypothetical protein